jgi:hypothetical protein
MAAICARRLSTTLSSLDRRPIEPRSEVALRFLHELAREGPKVGKLARVLWRNCDPEMMTVEREPRGSAARRPGPKVERPLVAPRRPNVWPRRPASFAAASPRQQSSSLACDPGCHDGCGRGRGLKSSSRVVIVESALADHRDGARNIEIIRVLEESASRLGVPHAENLQSIQLHAPARRRRFHLAVHGRRVGACKRSVFAP